METPGTFEKFTKSCKKWGRLVLQKNSLSFVKMETPGLQKFLFSITATVTVTVTDPSHSRTVCTAATTTMALTLSRSSTPYTSSGSDTDSISMNQSVNTTPTTALRRLYFKTAKTCKMTSNRGNSSSSTVPKVISK